MKEWSEFRDLPSIGDLQCQKQMQWDCTWGKKKHSSGFRNKEAKRWFWHGLYVQRWSRKDSTCSRRGEWSYPESMHCRIGNNSESFIGREAKKSAQSRRLDEKIMVAWLQGKTPPASEALTIVDDIFFVKSHFVSCRFLFIHKRWNGWSHYLANLVLSRKLSQTWVGLLPLGLEEALLGCWKAVIVVFFLPFEVYNMVISFDKKKHISVWSVCCLN